MIRKWTVSLVLSVAVLAAATTSRLSAGAVETLKVPAIVSIQPDPAAEAIRIRGVNLPADMPTVTLGSQTLQVLTWNSTEILALVPGVTPGSYLVTVQGRAWYQLAVFVATIGTQGPKGDPGEPGSAGPRGDPGPPGAK